MHALFAGLVTFDMQFLVAEHPAPNTKTKARDYGFYAGGPATNAAVAFAALGGTARLFTALGKHPLAHTLRHDLESHHVEIFDYTPRREAPPTFASVLTNAQNGDRAIVSYHPESLPARPGRLPKLDGCRILLLDGFHKEITIELAKEAKKRSIPVVLDGGSWKKGLENLLPFTDIVIASADFFPPATQTQAQVFEFLARQGVEKTAITRGKKPVLFRNREKSGEFAPPKIQATDTLAAGDVFHGAFCYFYAQNSDFRQALQKASEIAALACQSFGTRQWIRSL